MQIITNKVPLNSKDFPNGDNPDRFADMFAITANSLANFIHCCSNDG